VLAYKRYVSMSVRGFYQSRAVRTLVIAFMQMLTSVAWS